MLAVIAMDATRTTGAQMRDELIVLTADGRVTSFEAASGNRRADVTVLSPGSSNVVRAIARRGGNGSLFVSSVNRNADSTMISAVSLESRSIRTLAVLGDSIAYPFIAVGPRSGLVYAIADHQVHVVALDSTFGRERWRVAIPREAARDWLVYWVGVDQDEKRLFLSYHGSGTGVDWLDLTQLPPRSCDRSRAQYPSDGCIASHGNFAAYGAGMVAATGSHLIVVDSLGATVKTLDVGLGPQNHFMEFALDTVSAVVYSIGSCLSQGGLTRTPLSGTGVPAPVLDQGVHVCGDQVLLSKNRMFLFVSRDRKLSDSGPGEIAVIDLARRRVAHRIAVSAKVVGIVASERAGSPFR